MPQFQVGAIVKRTQHPPEGSDVVSGLLKRQHGVITRGQALACGIDQNVFDRRVRSGGPWQRLLPGVYLTVTGTPTQDQLDVAALLYAGPASMISGAAALRRHGVRVPSSRTVDVLVPGKRRRQSADFVVIRLTTRLPEQVCYAGAVHFALPARAVADAARLLGDLADVRATVAAAVQTGLCTIDQLVAELRDGPAQGSAFFRTALAEVTDGIRSSREAEMKTLIKRGHLPLPLFNARLYCGEELIAIADAWWQEAGLVAEVDSKEWHLSPKDWEKTMARHARLTALGILVLHFTPRQIRDQPDQVLATIRQALASRGDQPQSPMLIRTVPAEA
jgi:very-short-patch-repair endonuclease